MKIGDIVIVNRNSRMIPAHTVILNKIAKVVYLGIDNVGLEFDFPIVEGHNCNGHGQMGRCWYVDKNCVQLMELLLQFNH